MPWDKLIGTILGIEGGVHPALFVMALVVIGWLVLELRADGKARRQEFRECSTAANAIYEKRIEEQKQVLIAMERVTVAMATLSASVESRTKVINELVQGFGTLASVLEANRDRDKELGDRVEKRQEDILSLLRSCPAGRRGQG